MSTSIRPNRPARAARLAATPVLGAILVATLTAGCAFMASPSASPGASAPPSGSAPPSASEAPPGPLVSVETRGGHCIGGTCGSIVVLGTDGTVRTAAEPPVELGTVATEDVTGLTGLIAATDFAEIRSHPFTGTCPVAFDGQEVVYEFTTAGGIERIESCITEVDPQHQLFAAVAGVLEDFIPLPIE
jgi:hypothetical protein